MRANRAQIRRLASGILILLGLTALTWCGVTLFRAHIQQRRAIAALQAEMASGQQRKMLNVAPATGSVLGSIEIPRAGISSAILEGADDGILRLSVGHIPDTALPGRSGNVALAGHRDTFFRGLERTRIGDDILVTTPAGSEIYEVESERVVAPGDVYVLNDIGRPVLTLVTCYPFHYIGPAPKRFIVRAHLIGDKKKDSTRLAEMPVSGLLPSGR